MSNVPAGTRPWRKSWRKRWREESSYRDLSLLQREFLNWIEANADDSGQTEPTGEHYLARLFSSPSEKVSRDAVHRAAVALERAGLVTRRPHSKPHSKAHRARNVYVRVNWAKYQDGEPDPHSASHSRSSDTRTELAEEGRRKQKKPTPAGAGEGPKRTPKEPIPAAFFETLKAGGYVVDDKARFAALRLRREGVAWVDITTWAFIGLAFCGARTTWFALSNELRSKVTHPQWQLEAADVRSKFNTLDAQDPRGVRSRGNGTAGAQPAPALRLPTPGPAGSPVDEPAHGPRRPAGHVQDGHHADMGAEPRPLGEVRDARPAGDGRGGDGDVLPLAALGR